MQSQTLLLAGLWAERGSRSVKPCAHIPEAGRARAFVRKRGKSPSIKEHTDPQTFIVPCSRMTPTPPSHAELPAFCSGSP